MKNLHRLLLPAVLLSLTACASNRSPKDADARAQADAALTGQVSEKEFKAMHELHTGAAPALHGTVIDVGGQIAYLSLPAGKLAPLPAVLVIHEWWGLNDNVKHWADRIAAEGYAALAIDLYGGTVATTPDQAMSAMKAVDPARALGVMRNAHRFLTDDARVKAPRTAVIGWCFGGAQSLRLGLNEPQLDAVVMYYGQPVTELEALRSLRAPLLGIFGSRDRSIPPDVVAKFDQALTDAGKQHTITSYDADHAFANPSNPKYDETNAEKAWNQARAFLAQHLK